MAKKIKKVKKFKPIPVPLEHEEVSSDDEKTIIVKKLSEILAKIGELDDIVSIYDSEACDILNEVQETVLTALDYFQNVELKATHSNEDEEE